MNIEEFTQKASRYTPHMRVEKTNSYRDDLRVLMTGVVFLIFLILLQPFMFRVWDWHVADRPFVFSTVEIFQDKRHTRPMILYDADANQNVSGTWTATIHDAYDHARISTRKGQGNYTTIEDLPKLWTWSAFFDNGTNTPEVPDHPFYICVRYDVVANDSGVDDASNPFCSAPFDPSNPRVMEENTHLEVKK